MKLFKKINLIVLLFAFCAIGATNDSTIDSAVLKRIYMGNYSYNTCISSQPILSMRWASDINRPVFKNKSGTLYKVLTDASTSSNTAVSRLFFADANGAASSSANLTFASDKLSITGKLTLSDSLNGANAKFTGRVTGTDIEVSDSIKAVSGSYSGRITGTDIEVSDSVKAVSGAFSGALSSSTLYTTGNASIGGYDLMPWSSSYKTLQIGLGYSFMSGTDNGHLITNAYFDGTNYRTRTSGFSSITSSANSHIVWYFSDSVGTNSVLTHYEKMHLTSTGLGINVATPQYDLHVSGDASIDSATIPILRGNVVTRGTHSASYFTSPQSYINKGQFDSLMLWQHLRIDGTINGANATATFDSMSTRSSVVTGDLTVSKKVLTDTVRSVSGNSKLVLDDDNEILLNTSVVKTTSDLQSPKISFPLLGGTESIYKDSLNNNIVIGQISASAHDAAVVINLTSPDSSLVIRPDGTMKIRNMPIFDTGSVNVDSYGFTSSTQYAIGYSLSGDVVTLSIPAVTGTSNSEGLYFGYLPTKLKPTSNMYTTFSNSFTLGGSTYFSVSPVIVGDDGVINVKCFNNNGYWPDTGTKQWDVKGSITYRLK